MGMQGRLLSELMRPQQLSDLTLPQQDIDWLQHMIDEGSMMNMLFYGQPGTGKTSAARILGKTAEADGRRAVEINGATVTSKHFEVCTIPEIHSFAWGPSSSSARQKLCFIDAAEHISDRAEANLLRIIDSCERCCFILAVNDVSKIIGPLHSRLTSVCFDIAPKDRAKVKERLLRRYTEVLSREGIPFTESRLVQLIGTWYPDLRAVANEVQKASALIGVQGG